MNPLKNSWFVREDCFCSSCGSWTNVARAVSLGPYKSPYGHVVRFRLLFCAECTDGKQVEEVVHRYAQVYERARAIGEKEAPPTGYRESARVKFLDSTFRLLRKRGQRGKKGILLQEKSENGTWRAVPMSHPDYFDLLEKLKEMEKEQC
jgi:hypothetical protein